jgi:hypothetical protein
LYQHPAERLFIVDHKHRGTACMGTTQSNVGFRKAYGVTEHLDHVSAWHWSPVGGKNLTTRDASLAEPGGG